MAMCAAGVYFWKQHWLQMCNVAIVEKGGTFEHEMNCGANPQNFTKQLIWWLTSWQLLWVSTKLKQMAWIIFNPSHDFHEKQLKQTASDSLPWKLQNAAPSSGPVLFIKSGSLVTLWILRGAAPSSLALELQTTTQIETSCSTQNLKHKSHFWNLQRSSEQSDCETAMARPIALKMYIAPDSVRLQQIVLRNNGLNTIALRLAVSGAGVAMHDVVGKMGHTFVFELDMETRIGDTNTCKI